MSAASKQICVILGAGPGAGASIAKVFALAGHPVALLSRSLETTKGVAAKLVSEHQLPAEQFKTYAVDSSKEETIRQALARIPSDFGGGDKRLYAGICNSNGGFKMGGLLDTSVDEFRTAWEAQALGAFAFSQAFLEQIQTQDKPGPDAPTYHLLFSGATASVKGGPRFSAFASAKFALRGLAQSLAREWGPRNVHVGHLILDGMFDTERVAGFAGNNFPEDTRVKPE